jgi:hypothetical protein
MSYDPKLHVWASVVAAAELLVYAGYGHWHLFSPLEQPLLQGVGLTLGLMSIIWVL